jgi:hypothetical protein
MNIPEVKRVKVDDLEFSVFITVRSMIEFRKMTGDSELSFEGTERMVQFFYCTARAGTKLTGKEFNYSFDEFLDIIDPYYKETITNFSQAIFTEPGGGEKKQRGRNLK